VIYGREIPGASTGWVGGVRGGEGELLRYPRGAPRPSRWPCRRASPCPSVRVASHQRRIAPLELATGHAACADDGRAGRRGWERGRRRAAERAPGRPPDPAWGLERATKRVTFFPASRGTAILPPLAKVPGSVAGRTYRVKFWVSVEGRVTRVDVVPPIADAAYGREFQQRMMAYQFYPAHTRDGRNVTYVVTVPLRIGN